MKWIKLNDVIIGDLPNNRVVLTMMGNNRMFAYNVSQGIKGLCEVQKHHPEALCTIIHKPGESSSSLPEDGEGKTDFQIAWELSQTSDKPFFIDTVRKLIRDYDAEDISLSKFVEELNIASIKWHDKQKSLPSAVGKEDEQDKLAIELVRMVINSPSYGIMTENVINNFTLIKK